MSTTIEIPPSTIAKFRHGERLSREEFHQCYESMPDIKAELLDGVVYVTSSPVSIDHGDLHFDLIGWIYHYKIFTPGVGSGDNVTIRLSGRSELQPDVCLRILETHGGSSSIDEDRYLFGSPELLIEVARSSTCYDRTVKMPIYRQAGVRELILWRVDDNAIDWFVLRNGSYEEFTTDIEGIIRSETFPGLWLDVAAMLRSDGVQVFRVLQQGISSSEHAVFVEQLRQIAERK